MALHETTLVGSRFVLSSRGKPFASADGMSQRFSKWAREAGLEKRTAHGLRHRMLKVLAELGFSEYTIMAIAGHSDPTTTKRYTKNAERRKIAAKAMRTFDPENR